MRPLASVGVLLLVACVSFQEVQVVETLYFGTARPGGTVSEGEWRTFVEEVITPRFPGFTELNAVGHWKGEREGTYVLQLAYPPRAEHERKVDEIIAAYKSRFQQEAVLRVTSRALARAQ
ncbi:MAG TPA: DUF3574 domain-containing protein [Thermoanaerobaculia bacterium]|nr:DUF3574 domain-containing protein [Thermoanaerobaculia bacterium]